MAVPFISQRRCRKALARHSAVISKWGRKRTFSDLETLRIRTQEKAWVALRGDGGTLPSLPPGPTGLCRLTLILPQQKQGLLGHQQTLHSWEQQWSSRGAALMPQMASQPPAFRGRAGGRQTLPYVTHSDPDKRLEEHTGGGLSLPVRWRDLSWWDRTGDETWQEGLEFN